MRGLPLLALSIATSAYGLPLEDRVKDMRIDVSLRNRELYVIEGTDTLYTAPVAVGSGRTLRYGSRRWKFATPTGEHRVQRKRQNPMWVPPEWHYVEIAQQYNLKVAYLNKPVKLSDGNILLVRGKQAGILYRDGVYATMPLEEHIIFDNTIFIPPPHTLNRLTERTLGSYSLDIGNGYMLHGTQNQRSIGHAATHGCMRLRDNDIEWLYKNVPVGTRVRIRR